jgi:hypothetical protein
MRKSTNNAIEEWDTLLQVVRETEGELGGISPFRKALADAHAQARTYQSLRNSLAASTRDARQRFNHSMTVGEDAAVALRGFIRSVLGPRSDKLRSYGIKPLGGRRRIAR